jgi:tripartite-type tricarboxylate transporter receptor subunit TctC
MQFRRRKFLYTAAGVAALASALILSLTDGVWSQTARTIKLVIPVPSGGSFDILARLMAEQIGRTQGLTMIVESRPGAGTGIATEAVSRATPDGNTLLFVAPAFVVNPHLRKLNYDPLTSFEPICQLVTSPQVIVVNSASPYRTLADLLSAARAKPGELTMASVGPSGANHIAVEKLKRAANVDMTYVPYSGNILAVGALLGGHVTSALADYSIVAEHLNAGKLRALATASRARIEPQPDLPTVAESGYADYELDGSFGLVAPAKTPREMVSQFANWFKTAIFVPEVKAKLVDAGLYPVGVCGTDYGTYLRKQFEEYGRIVREVDFKAE